MQLTSGNLYWKDKSKIENIYPYLTHDTSCDVLVIGGGINGAITALFLAKEGANVIVKNIIGYGSTSASSALLEYQLDMDMCKLERSIGREATNRVYNLCLTALDKIEKIDNSLDKKTGFKRQDALYYTNKFMQKPSIIKEYKLRKDAGFNLNLIDSHELLNINCGMITKNASGIMNPYLFTQAIFGEISKLENVKVYENTRIDDVKSLINNVICTTNNDFKIKAESVIFSSGYETLKYLSHAPVEISKTFTIVSKPIKKLKRFDTSFTARDNLEPFHYLRFDNNARVIFSGEEVKFTDKLTNKKVLNMIAKDKYKKLYNLLQKTLSGVEDIEIEYMFNGTSASTKDSLPIIDEMPGMANCFCNIGFGSNAILHSVIGANMLKNAVKGYYTKDMNMFRIDR